ncbi:hypothetical protein GCM10022419_091810 [Nonomuraea rosea]|uniref:Uncharacterized protein n=1 Tax=Nonomuraea rosea TaxID=638574 RepID=A0ABP6Z2C6_9ACTN
MTQSGFGMGMDVPVSVSLPDRGSRANRLTVLLTWFATSSHRPPRWIEKVHGDRPPQGTRWTSVSPPVRRSAANTTMVFSPRRRNLLSQ